MNVEPKQLWRHKETDIEYITRECVNGSVKFRKLNSREAVLTMSEADFLKFFERMFTPDELDAKFRELVNGNDSHAAGIDRELRHYAEQYERLVKESRDYVRAKLSQSDEKPSWESSGPTLSEVGDRKNFPRP